MPTVGSIMKIHGIHDNRSSLSYVLEETDGKLVFIDTNVTLVDFFVHLKTDGTVEQFAQMHDIEKWRMEVLLSRLSEIFT